MIIQCLYAFPYNVMKIKNHHNKNKGVKDDISSKTILIWFRNAVCSTHTGHWPMANLRLSKTGLLTQDNRLLGHVLLRFMGFIINIVNWFCFNTLENYHFRNQQMEDINVISRYKKERKRFGLENLGPPGTSYSLWSAQRSIKRDHK